MRFSFIYRRAADPKSARRFHLRFLSGADGRGRGSEVYFFWWDFVFLPVRTYERDADSTRRAPPPRPRKTLRRSVSLRRHRVSRDTHTHTYRLLLLYRGPGDRQLPARPGSREKLNMTFCLRNPFTTCFYGPCTKINNVCFIE